MLTETVIVVVFLTPVDRVFLGLPTPPPGVGTGDAPPLPVATDDSRLRNLASMLFVNAGVGSSSSRTQMLSLRTTSTSLARDCDVIDVVSSSSSSVCVAAAEGDAADVA